MACSIGWSWKTRCRICNLCKELVSPGNVTAAFFRKLKPFLASLACLETSINLASYFYASTYLAFSLLICLQLVAAPPFDVFWWDSLFPLLTSHQWWRRRQYYESIIDSVSLQLGLWAILERAAPWILSHWQSAWCLGCHYHYQPLKRSYFWGPTSLAQAVQSTQTAVLGLQASRSPT